MAIKLSQKDLANAKSWLFDVFLDGGLLSPAKAGARPSVYDRVVGRAARGGVSRFTALNYCKDICAEIRDRQFKNLDTELTQLANIKFQSQLGSGGYIKRSPEHLAAYIAQFCKANGIYWDTEIRSHQEVDEFERTLLGAALKEYGCFTTSEDTPVSSTNTKAAASSRRATTAGASTSGQPPKNDYKSSGGQSQNVRDLKGTPGNKVMKTSIMYRIEGVNANTPKTPYVFIRPLKASGAAGNTNKVFVGDPSGYTDCTLFFDDHVAADKVLVGCTNANIIPTNISGLHVSKIAPDRNGYYEVGTEFGNAFIKASKLNEALDEDGRFEVFDVSKEDELVVDYTAFAENLMKE